MRAYLVFENILANKFKILHTNRKLLGDILSRIHVTVTRSLQKSVDKRPSTLFSTTGCRLTRYLANRKEENAQCTQTRSLREDNIP